MRLSIAQAYADAIKQNLGIDVEVKSVVQQGLHGRPAEEGCRRQARHHHRFRPSSAMAWTISTHRTCSACSRAATWAVATHGTTRNYQDLLAKADPMTDTERAPSSIKMPRKLMTESAAFVWAVHRTPLNLWKPYIKGSVMAPGKVNTNPGVPWPGMQTMIWRPQETTSARKPWRCGRTCHSPQPYTCKVSAARTQRTWASRAATFQVF